MYFTSNLIIAQWWIRIAFSPRFPLSWLKGGGGFALITSKAGRRTPWTTIWLGYWHQCICSYDVYGLFLRHFFSRKNKYMLVLDTKLVTNHFLRLLVYQPNHCLQLVLPIICTACKFNEYSRMWSKRVCPRDQSMCLRKETLTLRGLCF